MQQDYYLIKSHDYERVMELVIRALNSAAVEAFPPDTTSHECALTYAGAYGTTYATLGIIKYQLTFAEPFDPSLEPTPF